MSAESLNTFEEAAPNSSIREAAVSEPRISVEIRTSDAPPRARALVSVDDAIGRVLGGKYRVERKLGEGAMGVVLAATHIGLDEPVAIKFMRPEVHGMAGTLDRFAKEAKIAARIRSEHVAKVLDVGEVEPLGPYIVMEYLEGKSLADLLDARLFDRQGPMAPERVVEYVLQACEALATAHAIGVIHRDVKPDNLFLTRHGGLEVLKLLDFGISKASLTARARASDAGTGTASFVMGTPLYMSPEQLRSAPDIDCRTDIWSMGAVMYELLSGSPPFPAASVPEICASILESTPAALPASCPAALRAVVVRCLEKDRERRFQTVAALAAALVPLAPGDARAYASRSSGILRASTLNLDVASGASPERKERRAQRFQSSALVAAATVLALSVLGVTITIAKMRRLGVEEVTATALTPAPVAAPSVPVALPAASGPSAPVTPRAGEPPAMHAGPPSSESPAPITGALPVRVEASSLPLPSVDSLPLPGVESLPLPGVESLPPPGADAAAAPKLSSRHLQGRAVGGSVVAGERPKARTSVGTTPPAAASAGAVRASRVRLVDERPKLRLVNGPEVDPRRAADGTSIIRRIGDDSDRSRP